MNRVKMERKCKFCLLCCTIEENYSWKTIILFVGKHESIARLHSNANASCDIIFKYIKHQILASPNELMDGISSINFTVLGELY